MVYETTGWGFESLQARQAPKGAFLFVVNMKAHELKALADKANKEKEDPQIEAVYHSIQAEIKRFAKDGDYGHAFYLSNFNIPKRLLEMVADLLRKDGFKVHFDREITNWYSNTDYDEEEFMQVSWV